MGKGGGGGGGGGGVEHEIRDQRSSIPFLLLSFCFVNFRKRQERQGPKTLYSVRSPYVNT